MHIPHPTNTALCVHEVSAMVAASTTIFDIDDGDVHPERTTEIVRARFDAYSFDRRFSSSVVGGVR
jgi:hypothetical protein